MHKIISKKRVQAASEKFGREVRDSDLALQAEKFVFTTEQPGLSEGISLLGTECSPVLQAVLHMWIISIYKMFPKGLRKISLEEMTEALNIASSELDKTASTGEKNFIQKSQPFVASYIVSSFYVLVKNKTLTEDEFGSCLIFSYAFIYVLNKAYQENSNTDF